MKNDPKAHSVFSRTVRSELGTARWAWAASPSPLGWGDGGAGPKPFLRLEGVERAERASRQSPASLGSGVSAWSGDQWVRLGPSRCSVLRVRCPSPGVLVPPCPVLPHAVFVPP